MSCERANEPSRPDIPAQMDADRARTLAERLHDGQCHRDGTADELRAIRLLTRDLALRSDETYLAHVERVAQARGPGADLARAVKRADLADRALHALGNGAGWSPPYGAGLDLLRPDARRFGIA